MEESEPDELHIFDLDGTMWKNPVDTEANRKAFEKATGIPWIVNKAQSVALTKQHGKFVPIRQGWYGRAETLEPPLVPDPAPADFYIESVVEAFLASKANPKVDTILMTGRHAGLMSPVLRLLHDRGLCLVNQRVAQDGRIFRDLVDPNVKLYMLGMDGPAPKGTKPNSTLPWKMWMIEQFLEHRAYKAVQIWEDRDAHVEEFRALHGVLHPQITVHHIQEWD